MDRLLDILLSLYGPTPYFLIFGVLLACGLGLPIPEDITLFAGALTSYYGLTNVWIVIVISYLGVMMGDFIIFYLGAKYGRRLTKKWFFHKILPDDRLNYVQEKLHEKGNKLIFAARFMPGFRAPIYFTAGALHFPYRVFLFYDGLAALISVPTIIGVVYHFGDEVDKAIHVIKKVEYGIFLVIIVTILFLAAKWYLSHRKKK